MGVINLSENNSLLNTFVAELRDIHVQNDKLRFRRNLERIGEVMAYEISKELDYGKIDTETHLGFSSSFCLSDSVVLGTILRAGIGFHHGFLNYFDKAENAFVSAYRKYKENHQDFQVHIEYIASPRLDGKTLIITDPMLATGESMFLAYKALLTKGIPAKLHIATVIASKQAIDFCEENIPEATIWAGAIDPGLDEHAYIVPGLGDAGDLAYGEKV